MKTWRLIADSSCDVPAGWQERLNVIRVPLTVTVNGYSYVDDGTVNVESMLHYIGVEKVAPVSACPAPEAYAAAMREADACVVVTLSGKLSGSYNAARLAREMVLEDDPDKEIAVIDSLSAASGELRLILLAARLFEQELPMAEIEETLRRAAASQHTLFVVEDLDMFIRSGRINKVIGTAASVLNICPILSDNGHGEIKSVAKVRGGEAAIKRMAATIAMTINEEAETDRTVVVAHTLRPDRAEKIREYLLRECPTVNEVIVAENGALSSVYASNGGVIVAF